MAATLSHPFRLWPTGQIATVDPDADAGIAEALALLVMTKRGERPLAPSFGLTDPTFRPVEPTEIAAAVAEHGPPVRITGVRVAPHNETVVDVSIDYADLEVARGPVA